MDIQTKQKADVLILMPSGRIDSANADEFQESLSAVIDDQQNAVIADLQDVSYMGSAGLRAVLIVAKALRKRGARFALCSMTPTIKDLFKVSGFSQVMTVLDSRAEALAHLRGPSAAAAKDADQDGPANDERPAFAIGHVRLPVEDVGAAHDFFVRHGLRGILNKPKLAIVELRGGTHLILSPAEQPIKDGAQAPFDLIVDDLDRAWQRFTDAGVHATAIERGEVHDLFHVSGPSGYWIRISSSHAVGPV